MGIAFQRSIRRKNETVLWPHIGQDFVGGIAQASQYATLTGLKDVRRGHRLEVKPFATLGGQQLAGEPDFERQSKTGLDLKYGLTSNLTLDLTWNTDFAQVETDNVQINLTRFDLFFRKSGSSSSSAPDCSSSGPGGKPESSSVAGWASTATSAAAPGSPDRRGRSPSGRSRSEPGGSCRTPAPGPGTAKFRPPGTRSSACGPTSASAPRRG